MFSPESWGFILELIFLAIFLYFIYLIFKIKVFMSSFTDNWHFVCLGFSLTFFKRILDLIANYIGKNSGFIRIIGPLTLIIAVLLIAYGFKDFIKYKKGINNHGNEARIAKKIRSIDKTSMALCIIMIICGILVMMGWAYNIQTLKSLLPQFANMKFFTAFSFVTSGIALLMMLVPKRLRSASIEYILVMSSLSVFFIMGIFFFSNIFGINSGFENLFYEQLSAENSFPGRPSIATMFSFLIISILGISDVLSKKDIKDKYLSISGWLIIIISAIAVIGYILGIPNLYYSFQGVNNSMALNTAILFIISGIVMLKLKKAIKGK